MAINQDIHTIDLMLGIPEQEDRSDWYKFMEPLLRDEESKSMFCLLYTSDAADE